MSYRPEYKDRYSLDLPFGLILGLLGGALAGILFAPKPGKELQDDVQRFVNRLPESMEDGLSRSKTQYSELVDKTKQRIEVKLDQRAQRKQALRMAEAKRREELEAGVYEY